MYFLEVKAFDDEFVAAQSQAMAAGGQAEGVQDLAAAQKEIVVATWKLDARGRRASAQSVDDVKAIATAQRALEQRAAKEAGSQLQGPSGSDPRRRRGRATVSEVSADPIGLAIEAMRRAATELERLQTSAAMPHELEALNQLLKAETDVKRRQVTRQQGGGGGGGNRATPDLSALFDQELRKQQQTNYETPAASETRQDERADDDPLARLRELARRQEAMSREQRDLARNGEALDSETVKRRLERLSRDQEELRRELEELARQMPQQQNGERQASNQSNQPSQAGQQPQSGQQQSQSQSQAGQSGQSGQQRAQGQQPSQGQQSQGQPGQEGSSGGSNRQTLRDAAEEMRRSAAGLQQQDPARASENAERALERLRQAEQGLRGSTADDRRRQLGDLQLEARQLADAERRVAEEMQHAEGIAERQRRPPSEPPPIRTAWPAAPSGCSASCRNSARRPTHRPSGTPPHGRRGISRASASPSGCGRRRAPCATAPAARNPRRPRRLRKVRPRRPGHRRRRLARTGRRSPAPSMTSPPGSMRPARATVATGSGSPTSCSGPPICGPGSPTSSGRWSGSAPKGSGGPTRAAAMAPTPGAISGRRRNGRREGEAADTAEDVAQLQRQLAEQLRETRERVEGLSRDNPEMRGPATPEEWQPSVSAPGTEAFKQDFARWESLKKNLLLALERVERSATTQLRDRETRERLNAGASDAVPDDYRALVQKYYQSLATPRRQDR